MATSVSDLPFGTPTAPPTDASETKQLQLSDLLERLNDVCQRLNMDEETKVHAEETLKHVYPRQQSKMTQEDQKQWVACALFAGIKIRRTRSVEGNEAVGSGIPLSQLLKHSDVQISKFFQYLKIFIDETELGAAMDSELKSLHRTFLFTQTLFRKYDKFYIDLIPEANRCEDLHHLGWSMFLVAKAKLVGSDAPITSSFHLLLAVMAVMMDQVIPDHGGSGENNSTNTNSSGEEQDLPPSLRTIVELTQGVKAQVLQCYSTLKNFLIDLNKDKKLKTEPGSSVPSIFMSASSSRNSRFFASEYESHLYTKGDIDERFVLNVEERVGTPSKPSPFSHRHGSFKITRNLADEYGNFPRTPGPLTPQRKRTPSSVPQTPMTAYLEVDTWLKSNLGNASASMNSAISNFCQQCPSDPTPVINSLLEKLTKGAFPSKPKSEELSRKLFFRALESMLRSESKRLRQTNFTTLLNNDSFHRALIACCVEVVNLRDNVDTFPAVLTTCGINAFDMFKLVESFVKHEPKLPNLIRRHLREIEERILEELAWKEDSPLFLLLSVPLNQSALMSIDGNTASASKPPVNPNTVFYSPMPAKQSSVPKHPLDELAGAAIAASVAGAGGADDTIGVGAPIEKKDGAFELKSHSHGTRSSTKSSSPQSTLDAASNQSNSNSNSNSSTAASASASGSHQPATATRGTSHSLQVFFRKVLMLTQMRVERLVSILDLSDRFANKVMVGMKHCLIDQTISGGKTKAIMANRHLDQIIMSAVYGIARVNQQQSFLFKSIIDAYKKESTLSNTRVFRDVLLNDGRRGDIIKFYNSVYIPVMKGFLIEQGRIEDKSEGTISSGAGGFATPTTPVRRIQEIQKNPFGISSPKARVTDRITLSPMKRSPLNVPSTSLTMTPGTKAVYAFDESPVQVLRNINSRVNPPTMVQKRLFDVGEESPSKKLRQMEAPKPQQS